VRSIFLCGLFIYVILATTKGNQMQTRSLKLRLQQLIDQRHKGMTLREIAQNLGLNAEVVVRRYLRNEARRLDRNVLERACDWLDVDIGQLLELVPCNFFPPGDKLLSLFTKEESQDDYEGLSELGKLFNNLEIKKAVVQDPVALTRYVYERNCAIVGSPHHNSAGEIALCTLFGADPRDTSDENRRKLPLLIEAPAEWHDASALVINTVETDSVPQRCHVMVPESGEKSDDLTFGKKSSRATADLYPLKDFKQVSFGKAKDFGIILVADHWVGSDRKMPVRTYWLSGFSSVGTLASLWSLKNDVRGFSLDTSPDKPGEFILCIVQTTFRKQRGYLNRDLNDDHEIVHKIRGSLPFRVQGPGEPGKDKPKGGPVGGIPPKPAIPVRKPNVNRRSG
jgi:transcriptional regulator with XRE-family HTH domain